VSDGKRLPRFDWLLRCRDSCAARRRRRITRGDSTHCADIPALDRRRAWLPTLTLDEMGGPTVSCILAAGHDSNLDIPARLGTDRLRNVFADGNRNDYGRRDGVDNGNR